MDNSSIVKTLQVENMSHDEQMALLDSIQQTIKNSKVKQKERANSNAQLVVQALKKIKQEVETRFDELNQNLEEKVNEKILTEHELIKLKKHKDLYLIDNFNKHKFSKVRDMINYFCSDKAKILNSKEILTYLIKNNLL